MAPYFIEGTSSTGDTQGAVRNLNINPLIAALPLIGLTLVVGFVGAYTLSHRGMWQRDAALKGSGLPPVAEFLQGKKIGILEFQDVAVTVPMSSKVAKKKRAALRAKALARRDTSHTFYTQQTLFHKLSKTARERFGLRTSDDAEVLTPTEAAAAAAAAAEQADLTRAADFVASLHDGEDPTTWTVVRDCSGFASGGQVLGVLGPSGCGKTTLLGAIAGSPLDLGASAVFHGRVSVDGVPRQGKHVAFVPQEDTLIPTLTVSECIRYSALLRLPGNTSLAEIHHRVDIVLAELGLRHVADSAVGGSGRIRGISGGERRRVTIGMELVIDPSIIVLDEPTSGLDSFTALNLMKTLQQVAAGGRVVMASLHQPSKDMFYSLDKVILMGHGRVLFAGRPDEVDAAFASAGVPCPSGTALAEHMLKVASSPQDILAMLQKNHANIVNSSQLLKAGHDGGSSTEASPSPSLLTVFEDRDAAAMEAAIPFEADQKGLAAGEKEGDVEDEAAGNAIVAVPVGFSRQLAVMFWRTFVDIIRNPTLLLLHIGISTVAGVLVGAIFFQLGYDSIGVQNRMGATFFALAFLAFTSLTTVDLLMDERRVVMREVRAGYYQPSAYLLSKLALDGMLLRVLPAILFWVPFYYMAGFRNGSAYSATYAFGLVAFNCTIGALSMAVTVGSATAGQASFIMNFSLLFSLAFTGFLVNVNSIPSALRWLHAVSPFYYAFEALLTNELNGQEFLFQYQASVSSKPV